MGQTRMFRDRVVSMEQTLEGGEKHLPILKELCREALPELEYREHVLDHERDLFVMDMEGPGGVRKRIAWTRMMLFDAERLPTVSADPTGALRARIVEFIRTQAARPEILVTFRHLEDGWVDTPEPKRESRRRRRGGRGGRGERGERAPGPGAGPDRRPQQGQGGRPQPAQGGRSAQGQGQGGRPQQGQRGRPQPAQGGRTQASGPPAERGVAAAPSGGRGPAPARAASAGSPAPGGAEGAGGGKRRRRFRKRRRGGGGRPGGAPEGGGAGGGGGAPGGSGAGGSGA